MLRMLGIGIVLVGVTFAIHAFGSTHWMEHLARRYTGRDGQWRTGTIAWCLMSTGAVLMVLHLVESLVWALAFLALPETQLNTFEEAAYFSIVTFTTLGYGDITLDADWRLMSGIEAVNGILLAGWSTALLFSVVQRSWKLGHKPKG
jgi:hypothetical protein